MAALSLGDIIPMAMGAPPPVFGSDAPSMGPVWAILGVVLFAVGVLLVLKLVKPRREIGDDFFEHPRPVAPTQPDVEDPEQEAMVVAQVTEAMRPSCAPQTNGGSRKCRVCGKPEDPDAISMEEWLRVETKWGNVMEALGRPPKLRPGRRLYVMRGWCRSCGKMAVDLNSGFRQRVQIWVQELAIRIDAAERVWEERGLEDAVTEAYEEAQYQYEQEKKAQEREKNKARARELL